MPILDPSNPVFTAYLIAAALMILKLMTQGWVTVALMMSEKSGYASPEDLRQSALNPDPDPAQIEPNPKVERARRMHRNDLENIPGFLFAGLLFVLIGPPVWAAYLFFFGFVIARALHAWAYGTAQTHELRATFWTVGSAIVLVMTLWVLAVALM